MKKGARRLRDGSKLREKKRGRGRRKGEGEGGREMKREGGGEDKIRKISSKKVSNFPFLSFLFSINPKLTYPMAFHLIA